MSGRLCNEAQNIVCIFCNRYFAPSFGKHRKKLLQTLLPSKDLCVTIHPHAGVMELADVLDSKSSGSDTVRVRPPPPAPTKNEAFASFFFYPSRRLGISSRVSVYIIAVGVYHHRRCILLRLDDIQNFVLMICNPFGIDDIQGFALITSQNHGINGIIYYTNLNFTR